MGTARLLKVKEAEEEFFDIEDNDTASTTTPDVWDAIRADIDQVEMELDLLAFDADSANIPEAEGLTEGVAWTVDSGASEPVADPSQFPDCTLEPFPGSLAGQTYIGPGAGSRMKQLGQFVANRMLGNGTVAT